MDATCFSVTGGLKALVEWALEVVEEGDAAVMCVEEGTFLGAK